MDAGAGSQVARHSISATQRPPARNLGPLALLQPRYFLQTILLWIACFLSLGNIALLTNWMPTFFQELGGIPIEEFAVSAMISFIGGATGTLIMGCLMDRVNPYGLIVGFFLVEAMALCLLGHVPFTTGAVPRRADRVELHARSAGRPGSTTSPRSATRPRCARAGSAGPAAWGRIAGIAIARSPARRRCGSTCRCRRS